MKTRPWSIIVLAVGHFIFPFVNAGFSAFLQHLNFFVILSLFSCRARIWSFRGLGLAADRGHRSLFGEKNGVTRFSSGPWPGRLFRISKPGECIPAFSASGCSWLLTPSNIGLVSYFLLPAVRGRLLQREVALVGDQTSLSGEHSRSSVGKGASSARGTMVNLSEGELS